MPGTIGEAEAERIVLKPVAIEGEDLDAFHRILAVADGDVAADHPGVEQGADEAPEAGRQAGRQLVPAGQQHVVALAPLRLQRRDRELYRSVMRARRPVRDVAAIDVDLEGFALIAFAEGRGEGAVGVCLELAEEGGLLGLDLGVSRTASVFFGSATARPVRILSAPRR